MPGDGWGRVRLWCSSAVITTRTSTIEETTTATDMSSHMLQMGHLRVG
jgi:hypothetical protein